jgi:hypothetical protein
VTQTTTPSVPSQPGTRARAKERPGRCRAPKVDTGLPCRRDAGAGTDHWGEGPCSDHDDSTWTRVEFSEDVEAQEAFLAAVEADPTKPTRALIEPLGYRKRDVHELEQIDPDFRGRLEEARGQDLETLRREAWRRAIEQSDRLLELLLKMKDPEAAVLRQSSTRLDGQVDVRAMHYVDLSDLSVDSIRESRQAQLAGCSSEAEIVRVVVGWINPSRESLPEKGQPVLELVSDTTRR